MEPLLSLQNAAVGYTQRAPPVLEDMALHVRAGEFVGVAGPNGSGKSTLVRTLSRVLAPLSGAVLLDGRDLYRSVSARHAAQAIGVVPQAASASLEFSVREIVEMGRAPHLAARPFAALSPADTAIVDSSLQAAGVDSMAHRLAPTLSGGEWQRVLLARALAQQPDVLLLDEPTAHLDLHHQRLVLGLARTLAHAQGKAVLAILHDLNLAAEFCDRLVLVHAGRIAAEGTPAQVLTPATLAAVYDAPVWVRPHPLTGRPHLLALPDDLPLAVSGPAPTVHVVCGLGTGAGLLPALRRAGWGVTCGVLGGADPDAEAARLLGIPFPLVAPFMPPSPEELAEDARLALAADAVVIAPVPVGPLNQPSLDNAQAARRAGVPVFRLDSDLAGLNNPPLPADASVSAIPAPNGFPSVPDLPALLRALDALPVRLESPAWKP